jgi:tetratricopeptide (TPR) repeat protein
MGPAARYALHLASGVVLLQAGRHQRAEQELFLATSLHPEPHGVKNKMRSYKGLASASSLTAVSVSFIFIFKLLVLMPMLAAVMLPRLRRRLRALRWWGHTAACVFWLLLWWFAGAYRALALTATVAGRWDDAAGHWKNALFLATSDDSEYLQRLGALLVRLRACALMPE